jgi:hypothetical protein
MLWIIFVILIFLWLPGLVSGHTMGGVTHIPLVIAIIVLGVDLFKGERYWRDLDPKRRRLGISKRGGQQC